VKTGTAPIIFTGMYGSRYKPARKGVYRMQTSIAATDAYAAAASPWRTFKVK